MFMHKISMDCIMARKMFTFRVKSSLGSKIVVTWRFILLDIIISNVRNIQSYLISGILSIQKNWSHANAIFFQVQDCLKIYSCSSYDVISLINVRLTCCRPVVGFGGGALPCRSLLKTKVMTFVSLVIVWTMFYWIRLIFVSQNLKYSNCCFYRISSCVWACLSSIWILTSWIQLMELTNVASIFSIVSVRLLWAIFDFCLILVFSTLWWDWTKTLFVASCVLMFAIG
jgi:hypothetical protein